MRKNIFISLLLLVSSLLSAQEFTVSGSVVDESSGEDLIGVNIAIREIPTIGVSSNTFGFYSLSLKKNTYTFIFSYLGYKTIEKTIVLDKDIKLNLRLKVNSQELSEVVVSAERLDENVVSTDIGVSKLSIKDVDMIPVLFGEKDIMKTIQLLPGVKPAGDGNSGF